MGKTKPNTFVLIETAAHDFRTCFQCAKLPKMSYQAGCSSTTKIACNFKTNGILPVRCDTLHANTESNTVRQTRLARASDLRTQCKLVGIPGLNAWSNHTPISLARSCSQDTAHIRRSGHHVLSLLTNLSLCCHSFFTFGRFDIAADPVSCPLIKVHNFVQRWLLQ